MCEVIPERLLGEILRLLFSRYNVIVRPSLQGPEGDNQYIWAHIYKYIWALPIGNSGDDNEKHDSG